MESGVDRAWGMIETRGAEEICAEALCSYDSGLGCFRVTSLGMEFMVFPGRREIRADEARAGEFLAKHALYLEHALLWFLASGRNVGRTGRLIKPSGMKGGHHFFTRGTHVLPLEDIAGRYASDREVFLSRASQLGGREAPYGDAASEIYPLSGLPVVVILWLGDDEFPARADMLIDSSAEFVAPLDIVWSALMLVAVGML